MERWLPKGKLDCCYQKNGGRVPTSCPQRFCPYLWVSTIPGKAPSPSHRVLEVSPLLGEALPLGLPSRGLPAFGRCWGASFPVQKRNKGRWGGVSLGGLEASRHQEPGALSGRHDVISLFCACKKCGLNTACLTRRAGLKDGPN